MRPLTQPFIRHHFVRAAHSHTPPANRRRDTLPTGNRYRHDPSLRADDPHIKRINKQSFDKQRAIEQLTRNAGTWQDRNRNNKTEISYTFKNNWDGTFNEHQRQEARRSMESWSDVANLAFTENGGHAEGRLSFAISKNVATAYGFYPSSHPEAGNTVYNPDRVTRHDLSHEIGHALGLSHPGNYDGHAHDGQRVYAEDSRAHTLMSYFDASSCGKRLDHSPKAPMMDGISAIQHKYGANYQTRREDNTYGFNSNTNRDYYSLKSDRDMAVFCIWDGGGNDTLDMSQYNRDQVLNLRAGSFSDVAGYTGNVSIARGCTIENAIAGHGNDVLIGNQAGNRLTGGAGGDRMRGAGGADTFVYNHVSDSLPENPDEIMDFTSGTDKIDVSRALKSAGLTTLSFVSAFSGIAGEGLLTYDEKSGNGSVSIDTTGDGKANLLINTHGQIKPQDILTAPDATPTPTPPATLMNTPLKPQRDTTGIQPHFIFNKASESGMANSRLLTHFVSGKDKIDLRGVQEEANTRFTLVKAFTGRIGDTVVKLNPQTQRYFIAVDLPGNRRTDFLVRSTQLIRAGDVIAG